MQIKYYEEIISYRENYIRELQREVASLVGSDVSEEVIKEKDQHIRFLQNKNALDMITLKELKKNYEV
jgi:hypothetical protein